MSTESKDIVVPDDVRKKYPNYTTDELKAYTVSKTKSFKGTIAVCVIYGTFALALLVISLLSSAGKAALAENFIAFLVTFTIGIIIVVLTLVVSVLNMKPTRFSTSLYDRYSCPDYWKLVKADDSDLPATVKKEDERAPLYNFKCVPDDSVYVYNTASGSTNPLTYQQVTSTTSGSFTNNPSLANVYVASTGTLGTLGNTASADDFTVSTGTLSKNNYGNYAFASTADPDNNQVEYVELLYADPNYTGDVNKENIFNLVQKSDVLFNHNVRAVEKLVLKDTSGDNKLHAPIRCDELFPAAFASYDEELSKSGNGLRCQYAKKCGIPWTGVCPDQLTTE